ncbi:hypothetical protein D3C87_1117940 [compost metagenome]
MQDVAVLRTGLLATAAKLQILVGHQHQLRTGHFGHFLTQTLDDFLRRQLPLLDRLEAYQHERVVGAVGATDEARDAFHRFVLEHGAAEDFHFRLHHAERQTVVAAHETDQLAGILLR